MLPAPLPLLLDWYEVTTFVLLKAVLALYLRCATGL